MERKYHTFVGGAWPLLAWSEIKRIGADHVWSGRLSTGIFGSYDCKVGNLGPKSSTEVLVAPGDEALAWLIDKGFRPCPVCKPHKTEGFYERNVSESLDSLVKKRYGDRFAFEDPFLLPFDARALPWEFIIPLTGVPPGRLYVSKGLLTDALDELRNRFLRIGCALPDVGWYDPDAPGRFSAYVFPQDTPYEPF